MSPPFRGGRRQGTTRSSKEYGGKTVYYCTGGARTVVETTTSMGLTWLPDGGHSPVTAERGSAPATLRCPACGLTKPLGYKRRRAIRDAGLTEVDISALPF